MLAYKAGHTVLSVGFNARLGPAGAAAPHSEPLKSPTYVCQWRDLTFPLKQTKTKHTVGWQTYH